MKPKRKAVSSSLTGLNGYEVAALFRSDDNLKGVLIIAISGYSPDMVPGCYDQGVFDHYRVKPVGIRTLLPLIHKVAWQYSSRSQPRGRTTFGDHMA
jgi:hypothetical protein